MITKYIRKDKQFILNFASVIGVGLTMLTAIKSTKKACKIENKNISEDEKLKKTIQCYIPPALIALSTSLLIIYTDTLTMNRKISLLNALMLAQHNYKDLKQNVEKHCDKKTRDEILKDTIRKKVPKDLYIERTGEKIFYEDYMGCFFTSTIDNVLKAEYNFNKQLSIVGTASLNDLYDCIGIKHINSGDYLGWSVYDGYYGSSTVNPWVDFEHEKMEDDDGVEYYHLNYSNQPEVNYDIF